MAVPFGRYELLTRLATGGMGEVFLARARDGDVEQVVVLKRVLPHLSADDEFRELFLDEARIAARLNHPNIARIFELGDVDGQWFLVMEYVAGKNLHRLTGAARARKQPVPFPVACRIVADAAAALDYAHRARDAQGRALKIVHRDVSPHNLLVGFDGVVKLIDFGVARAANRLQQAATGGLRGKYPYMSPEQAAEGALDHRSDQFSLGVVFWELLTGRRLFRADDDAVALQLVTECRVERPTAVRPEVPAALEQVAVRMLARDPGARFADCGEVRSALEEHLAATHAATTASHLAQWMRDLFPEGDVVGDEHVSEAHRTSSSPALAASLPDEGTSPPPSLPSPSTSFVGRTGELQALRMLTARERLLSLVGPGGVGKSRLAMEMARGTAGSAYADLAGERDEEGLRAAAARTMGLGPADALGEALAQRGTPLLVLDNVEGAPASAVVQAWRTAAPGTTFLVTTREPLALPGEHVSEVPPLVEASELFVERARAARPGWEPAADDPVDELVHRCDGLPLAIELAAARIAAVSPARLLEQLPRRDSGARRDTTMRGVIAWAWELLQPHEQAALAQLGVIDGGFSIEAVEAVVDLAAFAGAPWPLDVVQALRERALVWAQEVVGGELRFGLHECVREHALNALHAAGAQVEAAARQRSAAWCRAQGQPAPTSAGGASRG